MHARCGLVSICLDSDVKDGLAMPSSECGCQMPEWARLGGQNLDGSRKPTIPHLVVIDLSW